VTASAKNERPMLTVFGSINLDVSMQAPRLPSPGETLLGAKVTVSAGGKGANQAHAARRFGVATRLIGAVGEDAFAEPALRYLKQAGVDVSGVRVLADVDTGAATICVSATGENAIVVAPGANRHVAAQWATSADIDGAELLLLQLEVPARESMMLARRAKAAGHAVMLNAAPALDVDLLAPNCIDWLIVNETELSAICKSVRVTGAGVREQAERLAREWRTCVVATLGAGGAFIAYPSTPGVAIPALTGHVVDTTGAGDTFTGVLAAALAEGHGHTRALRFAVVAAGLACRRVGAQAAQPSRADIDRAMGDYELSL
jgi:ribokinase